MVANPKIPRRWTPQAYLERERKAETKSEYHNGLIVAMAGASPEHNALVFDLAVLLGVQIRGGQCEGFSSDMRVRVLACNCYYYPDIVIVCEEPRYEQLAGVRALLNPALIVEVLSESTETRDRIEKWLCYQTLDSLQAYVMVSQRRPLVEVYSREGSRWLYSAHVGLESSVALDAIGGALRLNDIYARITFPEPPANPAEPGEAADA